MKISPDGSQRRSDSPAVPLMLGSGVIVIMLLAVAIGEVRQGGGADDGTALPPVTAFSDADSNVTVGATTMPPSTTAPLTTPTTTFAQTTTVPSTSATSTVPPTTRPSTTAPPAIPPPTDPIATDPPPTETTLPGDLGLSIEMSQPPCDESFIVLVAASVNPDLYTRQVSESLAEFPGSGYLRTASTCSSLRPQLEGNNIYVVYYGPFGSVRSACAQRDDLGGDAYVKPLDNVTPIDVQIDC